MCIIQVCLIAKKVYENKSKDLTAYNKIRFKLIIFLLFKNYLSSVSVYRVMDERRNVVEHGRS